MRKIILTLVAGFALLLSTASAGDFIQSSLINGTNVSFYIGTGNNATDFLEQESSYSTNRTWTMFGTAFTPQGTNSTTGAAVPSWAKAVPIPVDRNGEVTDNLAIAIRMYDGGGTYTNVSTTIYIVASPGPQPPETTTSLSRIAEFDRTHAFSFVVDATAASGRYVVTNLPAAFLAGQKYVMPWKVTTGANPPDNGFAQILRLDLVGQAP